MKEVILFTEGSADHLFEKGLDLQRKWIFHRDASLDHSHCTHAVAGIGGVDDIANEAYHRARGHRVKFEQLPPCIPDGRKLIIELAALALAQPQARCPSCLVVGLLNLTALGGRQADNLLTNRGGKVEAKRSSPSTGV
ncbi:MAG: hypothetical protein ABIS25_01695 [Sphingomicrobium sp.]